MCRSVVILILTLTVQTGSFAQTPKLPFEATVTVAETYVRSGPGDRFYPTSKLKRGARVHVRRKDLGGWYMIDPPAGSFSWIRAEYVDRNGPGRRGSLNAKNIVVRVGSQFGTTRDVEQRRLSIGDDVEILDEATLDTNGVAIRMYKISPPRGEYRWVAGSSVMASDQSIRSVHDQDPYRVPSQVQRDESSHPLAESPDKQTPSQQRLFRDAQDVGSPNATVEQRPLVRSRDGESPATDSSVALEAEQQQLSELDDRFRQMIGTDTAQWDLGELEQGYRALSAQTDSLALQQQIELRFPAVAKYKKIHREYEKLVSLTRETQQRDARADRGHRHVVLLGRRQHIADHRLTPIPERVCHHDSAHRHPAQQQRHTIAVIDVCVRNDQRVQPPQPKLSHGRVNRSRGAVTALQGTAIVEQCVSRGQFNQHGGTVTHIQKPAAQFVGSGSPARTQHPTDQPAEQHPLPARTPAAPAVE